MTSDDTVQRHSGGNRSRKRGGVRRFVFVFVILTVGLLTGYHYAVESAANGRYLSVVARHTGWLLDQIGHRAVMRDTARGPQVAFLFRASPTTRMEDARKALAVLEAEGAPDARRDAARAEFDRLEAERDRVLETEGAVAARDERAFTFLVVPECGAIEVMVIYLAGVVAFPAGLGARLIGLLAGLPVLYGVNVLRLSCLGVVGALDRSREWFEFCHRYVWQSVYVIFVVLVWLAWIEFVVKRPSPRRS